MDTIRYVIVGTLLVALAGCAPSEHERELFVRQFVTSVYEGTPMYHAYFLSESRKTVPLSRARMTRDFKVAGWDTLSFPCTRWGCSYEYVVVFSNGADGVIYLRTEGGKVVRATISVGEPHTMPQGK